MAGTTHHKVLIVGGGTAGITVAASLKRHGPGGIDVAIVEPSDTHYYQTSPRSGAKFKRNVSPRHVSKAGAPAPAAMRLHHLIR